MTDEDETIKTNSESLSNHRSIQGGGVGRGGVTEGVNVGHSSLVGERERDTHRAGFLGRLTLTALFKLPL